MVDTLNEMEYQLLAELYEEVVLGIYLGLKQTLVMKIIAVKEGLEEESVNDLVTAMIDKLTEKFSMMDKGHLYKQLLLQSADDDNILARSEVHKFMEEYYDTGRA